MKIVGHPPPEKFGENVRVSLSSQIGDSQCHDYKINITVFNQLSIMRTINATSV